jgi:hypothetical protein
MAAGIENFTTYSLTWLSIGVRGRPARFPVRSLGYAVAALALIVPGLRAQQGISPGRIQAIDVERRTLTVRNEGKDREFVVAEETKVIDAKGVPLPGGFRNAALQVGARVRVMVRPKVENNVLIGLLLIGDRPDQLPALKVDMSGVKPLSDMDPAETYKGFAGGLYPGGSNHRPAQHEAMGLELARRIEPLDREGKPSAGAEGKIVVMSVGMSNAIQAFGAFMKRAAGDPEINPKVVLVNAAQGSMTADLVADVEGGMILPDGTRAKYWPRVDEILDRFGVTRAQVQAAWIKEADRGPDQGFPAAARILQAELANIVRILHDRFPNLKLVYVSSRTYAGWAKIRLNPEPYAYESGFAVKWLIEQQLTGDPTLNPDPARGPCRAPWLSWGPQLWANGTTPRRDGFHYEASDFSPVDGTHESPQGQEKIGQLFLQFFKTDTTTRSWFLR